MADGYYPLYKLGERPGTGTYARPDGCLRGTRSWLALPWTPGVSVIIRSPEGHIRIVREFTVAEVTMWYDRVFGVAALPPGSIRVVEELSGRGEIYTMTDTAEMDLMRELGQLAVAVKLEADYAACPLYDVPELTRVFERGVTVPWGEPSFFPEDEPVLLSAEPDFGV